MAEIRLLAQKHIVAIDVVCVCVCYVRYTKYSPFFAFAILKPNVSAVLPCRATNLVGSICVGNVCICVCLAFSLILRYIIFLLWVSICAVCASIYRIFFSCSFLGFSQRSRFPHEYMPICVCADTFLVRVYAIFQIVIGHFQLEPWCMDSFCRFALSVSPACSLFSIFPLPVPNRQ